MLEQKLCLTCGREIEWRRKWQDCWEEVRYCSARCRSSKPGKEGQAVERVILELLSRRGHGRTICPSEAARVLYGESDWRGRMEEVRRGARRLVGQGKVEILQGGRVVDPSAFKGPVRIRLSGQA